MKAKVKATGEIIDASRTENIITSKGVEKQYIDNEREWCAYAQSELEFIKEEPQREIERERLRCEFAKSAMIGLMAGHNAIYDEKKLAKVAVGYADALIAELKKGGDQ